MKNFFTLCFLATILLCSACTRTETIKKEDTYQSNHDQEISSVDSSNISSTPSVAQAFRSVLLNEATFFYTDNNVPYQNKDVIYEYNDYLNNLNLNGIHWEISQFAVVDLDTDGIPEIVLEIEDYYGFIILKYKQGNVYGNVVVYRALNCLKQNGFFLASSSAFEYSIGSMSLISHTFITNDELSTSYSLYYMNDIPIEQSKWEEQTDTYKNSPDAEWHIFSDEMIQKWITNDNTYFRGITEQSIKHLEERQNYLDSLSYLIDMTYDLSKKNQAQLNTDAEKYYNGCNYEMEKIYKLCETTLSGNELDILSSEQKHWQESLDMRMSDDLTKCNVDNMNELKDKTPYFTYGDIILRRTLYLINFYYKYK